MTVGGAEVGAGVEVAVLEIVTALVVLHMIEPLLITTSARTVVLPAEFARKFVTYGDELSTVGVTVATVLFVSEKRTSLTVPLLGLAVAVKFTLFPGFILRLPAGASETVQDGTGGVTITVTVALAVTPAEF